MQLHDKLYLLVLLIVLKMADDRVTIKNSSAAISNTIDVLHSDKCKKTIADTLDIIELMQTFAKPHIFIFPH